MKKNLFPLTETGLKRSEIVFFHVFLDLGSLFRFAGLAVINTGSTCDKCISHTGAARVAAAAAVVARQHFQQILDSCVLIYMELCTGKAQQEADDTA